MTPHDLRRTFCSKVTALGFGREAMNRVTNHKEGGIADVYDRHEYAEENKKIMETVARHLVTIAEWRCRQRHCFRALMDYLLLKNLSGQTKRATLISKIAAWGDHWVLLLRCSRPWRPLSDYQVGRPYTNFA